VVRDERGESAATNRKKEVKAMREKKWAKLAAMAAGSLLMCFLVTGSASAQTTLDSAKQSADEATAAAESSVEGVKAKAEEQ